MGNHKRIATRITPTLHQAGQQSRGLTTTELAVCREMGLSPDEYREANPVEPTSAERGAVSQGLSDAELAICQAVGVSPDEYRQANPVEPTGAERGAVGQGLSDAELAVCRGMGLSAEAYRQANPKEGSTQELEALIAEGLRDGRIFGPETARWLRQQGLAACRSHLAGMSSTEALKHGLSDAELVVCRRMGLSPEAYRQANYSNDQ